MFTEISTLDRKLACAALFEAGESMRLFGWRQGDTLVGEETQGVCLGSALAYALKLMADLDDGLSLDSVLIAGREAARTFDRSDEACGLSTAGWLARRYLHEAALDFADFDPQLSPDKYMHGDGTVSDNLREWNDHPTRSEQEVLALLHRALILAERSEPGPCTPAPTLG